MSVGPFFDRTVGDGGDNERIGVGRDIASFDDDCGWAGIGYEDAVRWFDRRSLDSRRIESNPGFELFPGKASPLVCLPGRDQIGALASK